MCGITPYHISILCENSWSGGKQYTPSQCGAMTLDQIYFALCDRKYFRKGLDRTTNVETMEVVSVADKDGNIRGRSEDGVPFIAKIKGQSLASRLNAEAEIKQREELQATKTTKGRKQRKGNKTAS